MVDDASRGLSGGATGMPLFSRIFSVLSHDYVLCITIKNAEKTSSCVPVDQLHPLLCLRSVVALKIS